MESPPSVEETVACIANLYHNPNAEEKSQANQWLQILQNSVFAWKVADQILHAKPNVESCYIAAQTMRQKIQTKFHEVPKEAHESLRDSLLEHLQNVDEQMSPAILTQLSLAMADLILLMPEWRGAVNDLTIRLRHMRPWVLLEVLVVLPEEISSRHLRLGANRRNEITEELKQSAPDVIEFLKGCVKVNNLQYRINAFKALTSWIQIGAVTLENIDKNEVMHEAFVTLQNIQESPNVYEAAADCVIALLIRLEDQDNSAHISQLEFTVYTTVKRLEEPYHLCVAHEDMDKALHLCRIFTELAETFLAKMLSFDPSTPHFAITILDNLLVCCGHPDYEIPDITFNFWYRLSEELYQKDDDNLNGIFRQYIERLINSLCRHCQMEPDIDGLLEDGDDFTDFRHRVMELIKDVVFIVGSANVFKHMFAYLSHQQSTNTWESTEAALFIMSAVARNLFPNENENVPPVLESILNSSLHQHLAVRHTSVKLVGELADWVNHHPEHLAHILNWLLISLREPKIASQAAEALLNICSQCQNHMTPHFQGIVHILSSLDSFQLKPNAAIGLIKGAALLISNMPYDSVTHAMKTLCDLQLDPLIQLLDSAGQNGTKFVRNSTTDPVLYLDRLAAIYRHVNLQLEPGQPHPAAVIATQESWPVLQRTCSTYTADSRIMERTCRTLRFVIRCIGTQSHTIAEQLVMLLVSLYNVHPHSCFLYLGSILVDEYAHINSCVEGLLEMMRAFLEPTFKLLEIKAQQLNNNEVLLTLKHHPDTVDDFFRLNARFLQRAALPYLKCDFVPSIIECALVAVLLDHKDANGSVMKFFFDLFHLGRSKEEREDFEERSTIISRFMTEYGPRITDRLINAAIFYLPSYTYHDMGDIFLEMMLLNRASVCAWLQNALTQLPQDKTQPRVTRTQLVKFHTTLTSAEENNQVTDAIREFCRLWR